MAGSAHEVVSALLKALSHGQHVYLATVMRTYGSSPRPVGSMMMYSSESGVIGSVSGGCIEEDVIAQIQSGALAESTPCLLTYGNNESLARDARFALPCGGELIVLVERFTEGAAEDWQQLEGILAERESCVRKVNIHSGDWQFSKVVGGEASAQSTKTVSAKDDTECFSYRLGPIRKLLIVGANPTAMQLASLASRLDFAVTICDPSEHLASHWLGRDEFEFKACYPDGFVARDFGDCASAVVTLSHDPRLDDMALIEALSGNAFYIGAMGSAVTSQNRRERLEELGLTKVSLSRLHAPIGIDIGSKTPVEIAISIAAQLVSAYTGC